MSKATCNASMLPRLLYLGDVPVEASYHGSALLHRLLTDYPPEKLTILETAAASQPARRLPHVAYLSRQIGKQRWLNTRFHPYAVAWFTEVAKRSASRISSSMNGSDFESVLTVAHGFGWLAAARVASERKVSLHLIVHDDWPRVANVPNGFRHRLDREFAGVYSQAQTRFCVSPAMSRDYEARYGAPAQVIYPSRDANCIKFAEPPARLGSNKKPFTIAFAGTINSDGYIRALVALQTVLQSIGGRLLLFGPLTEDEARQVGLHGPDTQVCGLLSWSELLTRLRNEADALFVPMSFDESERVNMEMAFPSKLADCTATGLPLLIYGPSYCSAVAWARENADVAEVVEAEDKLRRTVERLVENPVLRIALGKHALEIGQKYFSHAAVQQTFYQGLSAGLCTKSPDQRFTPQS